MSDNQNIFGQDMNNYTVTREELDTGLQGRTLNLEEFSHGVFLAFYKNEPNNNVFGLFGPEADIVHALAFFRVETSQKVKKSQGRSC